MKKICLILLLLPNMFVFYSLTMAQDEKKEPPAEPMDSGLNMVTDIEVKGNAKVESDAILALMETKKGDPLKPEKIQEDIKSLYDLNYFSEIKIYKRKSPGGIVLVVEVKEKPAITKISYEGMEEITEEDIKEKMETKQYTIVNESTITADVRMIEKQYSEKGYYLARVTYTLEKDGKNEVALTFHVEEGGKVRVGEVHILGNKYFSDVDLISKMASWPFCRTSAFSGASIYQDEFLKRDLEFISFYYRDWGFAEVKVAKPLSYLDADRSFVRITLQVEEGVQYDVGEIQFSGDILFPKEELYEAMKLKPGKLYRQSFLNKDVEMLNDKYGDLGYAYVDVYPKPTFHREKKLIDFDIQITKGDKVYFGEITILGNKKTRDNVIRRENEVHDSELYSGTGLTKSKNNINRLGFFEEVQVLKERDLDEPTLLNLKIKVKEKPTGQLQASIGFSPGQGTGQNNWFGQGRYDEKNQSGRGWETNLTGKWNGEQDYSIETSFYDPRVRDSKWSAGISGFYRHNILPQSDDVKVEEIRYGTSLSLGRDLFELVRGTMRYRIQKILQKADGFVLERFIEQGISSSYILGLSRRSIDNYIEPTEGSNVGINQTFTGGPILHGDFQYMETALDGAYYYPLDFTETYRTYFKLYGSFSYIYPMGDKPVPFNERYMLGGYNDLRGYSWHEIGPLFYVLRGPGTAESIYPKGGDKKLYFQYEYYVPLIQEAGIKALIFYDMGRVYDDTEPVVWKGFNKDLGFGFRWITPIAPFRFEWAYPVLEDGKLGDMKVIFYLGY